MFILTEALGKKKINKTDPSVLQFIDVYQCFQMANKIYVTLYVILWAPWPPKDRASTLDNSSHKGECVDTIRFLSTMATCLHTLPIQRKATGTGASRPFQIGRHTSLKGKDRHSSSHWDKGKASECSKVTSAWQHGTVKSLCPFAEDREFPRKKQARAHAWFCSSLLCFHDHSFGNLIQHVLELLRVSLKEEVISSMKPK